jgi:hypothetical protein
MPLNPAGPPGADFVSAAVPNGSRPTTWKVTVGASGGGAGELDAVIPILDRPGLRRRRRDPVRIGIREAEAATPRLWRCWPPLDQSNCDYRPPSAVAFSFSSEVCQRCLMSRVAIAAANLPRPLKLTSSSTRKEVPTEDGLRL